MISTLKTIISTRTTRTISLLLPLIWLAVGNTYAQGPTPTGIVVAACGGSSLTTGAPYYLTVDGTGKLCAATTITGVPTVDIIRVDGAAVPNAGSGALAVIGITSSGVAIVGGPVIVGGSSGGNSATITIATTGGGVLVGGSTGGTSTTLVTDSAGRSAIVGAAASGQIPQGAPVLIGASDGTNVQTARADTNRGLIVTVEGCSSTTCYTTSVMGSAIAVGTGTSTPYGTTTTLVQGLYFNNVCASSTTVTVTDGNNVPFIGTTTGGTSFSIPAASNLALEMGPIGHVLTSGMNVSASAANCIKLWTEGKQ